jgi:hypothetical protein
MSPDPNSLLLLRRVIGPDAGETPPWQPALAFGVSATRSGALAVRICVR